MEDCATKFFLDKFEKIRISIFDTYSLEFLIIYGLDMLYSYFNLIYTPINMEKKKPENRFLIQLWLIF